MIRYRRTDWYGVQYLFQLEGSTLPRCLPMVLAAGAIAAFFSAGVVDKAGWPIRDIFGHPYAMQVLGLVFGYLSISRLNMSYNRYWEGVNLVKEMHSKWTTSCLQLLAFDRVPHADPDKAQTNSCTSEDPFCQHLVGLFKQLSVCAIVKLHADDWDGVLDAVRDGKGRRTSSALRNKPAAEAGDEAGSAPAEGLKRTQSQFDMLLEAKLKSDRVTVTKEEQEHYRMAPCATTACVSRIHRALTTRQLAGGVSAPSPLVARALQDLSLGLLAYNSACKMKEVPVPFAYVQVNALLLIVFNLLTPIAIASFTSPQFAPSHNDDPDSDGLGYNRAVHCLIAATLAMVVTMGFTAMWLVANELEDPFGGDANDIDVMSYHAKFCDSLDFHLRKAWLLSDHWITPNGAWIPPDANWTNTLKQVKAQRWRHISNSALSARTPQSPPGPWENSTRDPAAHPAGRGAGCGVASSRCEADGTNKPSKERPPSKKHARLVTPGAPGSPLHASAMSLQRSATLLQKGLGVTPVSNAMPPEPPSAMAAPPAAAPPAQPRAGSPPRPAAAPPRHVEDWQRASESM